MAQRQLRGARRDRLRDRPRADRPRARRGRARGAPLHDAARVDATPTSAITSTGAVRRPDLPDQLAGGVRVGRRQLRSARHRLRGRRAGREDRRGSRATCRSSRHHRDRPCRGRRRTRSRSRTSARAAAERDPAELAERARAVARDEPYTFIYTSGTTGPPKGCVLSHGNYRDVISHVSSRSRSSRRDDVAYLFLPLAHSFALLIQLAIVRHRRDASPTSAATRSRSSPSCPRSSRPICRRSRGSSRSSTRSSQRTATPRRSVAPTQVGLKVRQLQAAGQAVPHELQAHFDARRGEAVQERPRGLRRAAAPGRRPAPRRSPRRSSSSSSPAACR